MDMVIVNGSLITGDGITFLEKASVRIRGTKIVDVTPYQVTANEGDRIIDAGGAVVLPGIINAHAHGCIAGPSMPSGSLPLSAQDISYQRNRHLLSGTTTLLNVCGLATPDEIGSGALASHALDVQVSTAHTAASGLPVSRTERGCRRTTSLPPSTTCLRAAQKRSEKPAVVRRSAVAPKTTDICRKP